MTIGRINLFQFKDFRALVITRVLASMALQAQAVIVGWQIYRLKQDPLLLGLVGLAEAIPAIAFAFVSGYVVDSNRPARVYQVSLLVLFVNTSLLAISTITSLPLTEDTRVLILFAGVFVSGAARSFTGPAVFTLIPRLVPRNMIGAAAAMNSSAFQIAAIAGPAIGGFAFQLGDAALSFSLPPLFLALALVATSFLSPSAYSGHAQVHREPFLSSVSSGLRFAFGQRVLLSTMLLDMFSVLFGGAVAILPAFTNEIFKAGPLSLGILRAAPSVGSAVVALTLAFRPLREISGRRLLWVVAGFGASTVGFALSPNFWVAAAFLAASGAFDGVSMVIRSTILQLLTPDQMRGRVSAVSSVFITSSNEIGAFESGLAARLLGLVPSVIFGGAMTLGIVSATAWLVPELRNTRLKQSDDDQPRV